MNKETIQALLATIEEASNKLKLELEPSFQEKVEAIRIIVADIKRRHNIK